jgi:regulator of protease activity HflC (stomatin/prohibitin superfamily)
MKGTTDRVKWYAIGVIGFVAWIILGSKLFIIAFIIYLMWRYRRQLIIYYEKWQKQQAARPKNATIVNQTTQKSTTPINPIQGVTMNRKTTTAFITIAVIAVGILTSIKVINTGEVGVVTQFGKVTGRELGEGMNFILPYGFNSVTVYDVKVQKEEVATNAATQDLQDVTSTLVLNYRLKRDRVSDIHQTIGPTFIDKVIAPAMSEVFKGASAQYNAGQLITDRAAVKKKAYEGLKNRLAKYDIVVEDFSITNFQFSSSFSNAIEEKQVAQQNAERAKFNLEAAKTDAEAQKAQSETLSDAYLRKQAIEKWDGKMPQYVGGESVFNIPLR